MNSISYKFIFLIIFTMSAFGCKKTSSQDDFKLIKTLSLNDFHSFFEGKYSTEVDYYEYIGYYSEIPDFWIKQNHGQIFSTNSRYLLTVGKPLQKVDALQFVHLNDDHNDPIVFYLYQTSNKVNFQKTPPFSFSKAQMNPRANQ